MATVQALESAVELFNTQGTTEAKWGVLDAAILSVAWSIAIMRMSYVQKAAFFHARMEVDTLSGAVMPMSRISELADITAMQSRLAFLWLVLMYLMIVQMFRYFDFSEQLGIVTSTIQRSAKQLMPVLVVFIVIMVSYVTIAHTMFGERLRAFSTYGNSLETCLRMLLGDWDYGALFPDERTDNLLSRVLFFWSFIVVLYLLIVNMVLAIVFAVYDEIKSNLPSNMYDDMKRAIFKPLSLRNAKMAMRSVGNSRRMQVSSIFRRRGRSKQKVAPRSSGMCESRMAEQAVVPFDAQRKSTQVEE